MLGRKKDKTEDKPSVFCMQCGNAVYDDSARFCNKCGAELKKNVQLQKVETPKVKINTEVVAFGQVVEHNDAPIQVKELIDGLMEGKLAKPGMDRTRNPPIQTGWIVTPHKVANIRVPLFGCVLGFSLSTEDRTANALYYNVEGRGEIVHQNCIGVQRVGNRLMFMDGITEPADSIMPENVLVFYTKHELDALDPPTGTDLGCASQLIDGFRKGKFDGWLIDEEEGVTSITMQCAGGYFVFTIFYRDVTKNRLACVRDDCMYHVHNINKITLKKDGSIVFYNGNEDSRLVSKRVNYISLILRD